MRDYRYDHVHLRSPDPDAKGKIMSGNPVFRGARVPVHMLAELVPSRACARTRYRRGSVTLEGAGVAGCWHRGNDLAGRQSRILIRPARRQSPGLRHSGCQRWERTALAQVLWTYVF